MVPLYGFLAIINGNKPGIGDLRAHQVSSVIFIA